MAGGRQALHGACLFAFVLESPPEKQACIGKNSLALPRNRTVILSLGGLVHTNVGCSEVKIAWGRGTLLFPLVAKCVTRFRPVQHF
jgi:hypothetical protein